MCNLGLGRRHLVNAYKVEAGIGVIAGNTVWSMPERLECEVLQKVRYINTPFTFMWPHTTSNNLSIQLFQLKHHQLIPHAYANDTQSQIYGFYRPANSAELCEKLSICCSWITPRLRSSDAHIHVDNIRSRLVSSELPPPMCSQFLRSVISVSTSMLTWPWGLTSQPLSESASWLYVRPGECETISEQYNCCLPATTDCRRFCPVFCLILYGAPAMSLTW